MTSRMILISAVTAAVASLHFAGMSQAKQDSIDVPVAKVALFSSGVGYFEHAGSVQGNRTATLRFDADQINDVLKSLVLQDLDGGSVSTISYPSLDPLGRALRGFAVDLSDSPSIADLLEQLRGTKVSIVTQGERIAGTVLGVEMRKRVVGETSIDAKVVSVVTSGGIRSAYVDECQQISLDDPKLQDELNKALAAVAGARDTEKKNVSIDFRGDGERRVKLGYVVETPIWKTSYRLVISPDDKAMLQGWAIVENQTDRDWNDVQLSLVSGRPMSFQMDLYEPLYVERPTAKLDLFEGLKPQTYAESIETAGMLMQAQQVQSPAPASARARRAGAAFEMRDEVMSKSIDPTASVAARASASQIGELFEYTVGNVTLARQSSAMIPIVSDPVEVERVSIYNFDVLQKYPLSGARLKNTTGKHLLQGPITVFQAGSYAGDAQINNVTPGDNRLISYGIDLQTVVDAGNTSQSSDILTARIVKGVMFVTNKSVQSRDFTLASKSDKARTVIVEVPKLDGWELVDSPKPSEVTSNLYRFDVKLPAGKREKLTVSQQRVHRTEVALLPTGDQQLMWYINSGKIPAKVKDALATAVNLKRKQFDFDRQINEVGQQLNAITTEQQRIRENLKTVDRNSQFYGRLMSKLDEQETQIETLQSKQASLITQRDAARAELENYLANLNVE